MTNIFFLLLAMLAAMGCQAKERKQPTNSHDKPRIVSLDYCADQFVLKLADRSQIAGLSPDARKEFSYMRDEALGLPIIRPQAEDVLLRNPDIVVRSYGGGPNATAFFNRAGVKVVQIGYAHTLDGVMEIIKETASELGAAPTGETVVNNMRERLAALPRAPSPRPSLLYMTSRGAVAGDGTLIDELISAAGYRNFLTAPGWTSLPLEELAFVTPDMAATGFFETAELRTDLWTPARHPVAKRLLRDTPRIDLPGAMTACGAWFLLDAVEMLAEGRRRDASEP